jgi:hypothetical protein
VETEPVQDVMTEEAKRQFVILVFTLAGTYATLWMMSNISDIQGVKMRAAVTIRKVASRMTDVSWRQVEFWNTVTLAANALYDREKN